MAVLHEKLKAFVQRRSFDEETRTLVLIDKTINRTVWCKFVHRFDAAQNGPVELMFDLAFRTLSLSSENSVYTAEVLPILKLVPHHQIVIIEHDEDGCKVSSGDPTDVRNLMGLE